MAAERPSKRSRVAAEDSLQASHSLNASHTVIWFPHQQMALNCLSPIIPGDVAALVCEYQDPCHKLSPMRSPTLAFSPDSSTLAAVCSETGSGYMHQLRQAFASRPMPRATPAADERKNPRHHVVFSPTGRIIATSEGGNCDASYQHPTLRLWPLSALGSPSSTDGSVSVQHPDEWGPCARPVVFSADEKTLYAVWQAGDSSLLAAYRVDAAAGTASELHSIIGEELRKEDTFSYIARIPAASLATLGCRPGEDGLVAALQESKLRIVIFAVPSFRVAHTLQQNPPAVSGGLVVSPNGLLLAAWSRLGPVQVWDLSSGTLCCTVQAMPESENGTTDVPPQFTADSRAIVSCMQPYDVDSATPPVCAWEARTGAVLQTFGQDMRRVCGLAVSPSGVVCVGSGLSPAIRCYRLETGELLQTLDLDDTAVTTMAATPMVTSPDRKLLAVAGEQGSVTLFRMPEDC